MLQTTRVSAGRASFIAGFCYYEVARHGFYGQSGTLSDLYVHAQTGAFVCAVLSCTLSTFLGRYCTTLNVHASQQGFAIAANNYVRWSMRFFLLAFWLQSLAKGDGLSSNDVFQWSALGVGEYGTIHIAGMLLIGQYHASPRTSQGLVSGGGNDLGLSDWRWMLACCYQTSNVCHVDHKLRTNIVRDLPESGEIDCTCVSRSTRDD